MAGRQRASSSRESNVNRSMFVWVGIGAVILVAAFTFYLFGIDLGFVRFGGNLSINGVLWGAAICVVLSYVCDIMFIHSARKFFDSPPSILAYIPYAGMIALFDSWGVWVAWSVIGIALLIALGAFTPLGQFLPVDVIQFGYTNMALGIIGCMFVFTIVRGIYCCFIKRDALKAYNDHINDDFGSGGAFSTFSYALYFVPIIRMLPLYTDLNFLKNVKYDLDSMAAQEE